MTTTFAFDSKPKGQYPNEVMELELIGSEVREGYIEYGFEGGIAYHNNIFDYFQSSADDGKITLVFGVNRPLAASALHKLFTLAGLTIGRAVVTKQRWDGTAYATLEMGGPKVARIKQVTVTSGTLYLLTLQFPKNKAVVHH